MGKIKLISTNTFDYYFHNSHEIKKTFLPGSTFNYTPPAPEKRS